MHDVQDEVRALLQERSGDIGFDPRIPARVLRRSRRRQVLTVGGAGLGAAALALVVLAGLRAFSISDDKAPATETPPEPTPAVEVPSTFVGFADDAVVVASTETGEVLSTIAGPEVVGSRVHGADFFTTALALAPDRTAAYFSAFEPRGAGRRLMLAPLDGGEPEDLGPGWDPLPSPDGGRLAYVACAPDGCGGALVIRDLGTGAETRVPMGSSDMLLTPAGWLPDGRLAVNLYPGGSPASIRLIDPDRPPASLLDAPEVEPARADVSWWGVGSHAPTGGLLVAEACCTPQAPRTRIVSVDPDSGQVLGTVVRGGWWVVESDTSERHLLLVDDQGRVYVSRDGGEPQPIADGYSDVAW